MDSYPKTRREKEIWEACDSLYAMLESSEKVTGDLIYSQLLAMGYKKGSPNEVYRYRKSWKTMRGLDEKEHAQKIQELMPSDPISRAVQMVREEIQAEANQQIEALKAEYDAKLVPLEKDYARTKEELLSWIEKNDVLVKENNMLQATIARLEKDNQQAQQSEKLLASQLEHALQTMVAQKDHYEQLLLELRSQSQQQIKQLESQYQKSLLSWQQDASDYKTLLEKQRHESIVKIDSQRTEIAQLNIHLQQATIREELATQYLDNRISKIELQLEQTQEGIVSLGHSFLTQQDCLASLAQKENELKEIPGLMTEVLKKLEQSIVPPVPSPHKKKKQRKHDFVI